MVGAPMCVMPPLGNATAGGREYTGAVVPILGTRGGKLGILTRLGTVIPEGREIPIREGSKPR
jgi:hypothetical protein